jgi:CubicO group peptidase (beta-lactamase class C family)
MRVPEFVLVAVGLGVIALGCRGGQDAQPAGGDATGLISAETQAAVPIVTTDAELVASLERLVEQLVGTDEFSGVVLLSRHGQSLVRRAYGVADRERQRVNTVDTPFALASVSKMFTAVVVAQLVEKGLMSVDATIGSLLPAYPSGEARSKVTVHHLLTMSSGIADLFRSPQFWADAARISTSAELWPYFAYAPLEFEPGTKGSYSNSNFLVLGAITERLLGRPFIEIVEERIFRPVGMTRTGYRSRAFPDAAVGYTRRPSGSGTGTSGDSDQWHRAWDDFSPRESSKAGDDSDDCVPCTPMGGGYSTADDLARFAGAVMEGRLLSPDMTRRVLTGYVPANEYPGHEGYGFEMRLVGGVRMAGHRGGFRGVANRVEFYPDLGYVLVVLANTDADGAETIAVHLRRLVAASPVLSRRRQ